MEKIIKFSFPNSTTSQVSNREGVRAIFASFPKCTSLSLDFEAVDFISRAAAHELLLQSENLQKKGVDISFMNLNDSINKTIEVVSSSKKTGIKKATFVNWLKFDDQRQLDEYLEAI